MQRLMLRAWGLSGTMAGLPQIQLQWLVGPEDQSAYRGSHMPVPNLGHSAEEGDGSVVEGHRRWLH